MSTRYAFLVSFSRVALLLLLAAAPVSGEDWPTWRHDTARSGSTEEQLPADLSLNWARQLPAPAAAWPARQGKVAFDRSYNSVAAGGRLFVASMVEDALIALDLASGNELWRFETDGPVRFAPAVVGQHVLFGSDDGYLYNVDASSGSLRWRFQGAPGRRKVWGNRRMISMWPVRGAPVVVDGVVYFTAGFWPFMGVFVHAVDEDTGRPVWTNSGTGSTYQTQQHNSAAFAGVAPQGYLVNTDQWVLVPGGQTVPAAFQKSDGRLVYFRPQDRTLGNDGGGYRVVAGADWFSNSGRLYRLEDGQPLVRVGREDSDPTGSWSIDGSELVQWGATLVSETRTTKTRAGKTQTVTESRLAEQFRCALPNGVGRIVLRAGTALVTTDGARRLSLMTCPTRERPDCRIEWNTELDAPLWDAIVCDGRLIATDDRGKIYCFASDDERPGIADHPIGSDAPAVSTPGPPSSEEGQILDLANRSAGLVLLGSLSQTSSGLHEDFIVRMADAIDGPLIISEPNAARRTALRTTFRRRGIGCQHASFLSEGLSEAELPPYISSFLCIRVQTRDLPRLGDRLPKLLRSLRPYGGVAVIRVRPENQAAVRAVCGDAESLQWDSFEWGLVAQRSGPLPGAGSWTHQTGNSGNTLVSSDERVTTPLGLLWFGGESNEEVLPRHGHGPTPQVVGGRLFIEGPNMLRAVDVYTGLRLWQRSFPGFGAVYDRTTHQPGAGAIGGNFCCTDDGVYLIRKRECLWLDPATGRTMATWKLTRPGQPEAEWLNYVSVCGDRLIVGTDPTPAITLAAKPSAEGVEIPRSEGSRRLWVLNRHDGKVLWHRDAQFNYRHNAIAAGRGLLFCVDRMSPQRAVLLQRRGEKLDGPTALCAYDLDDGREVWRNETAAFGTWLAFEEQSGMLLEGGSPSRDRAKDEKGTRMAVFRGATGQPVWDRQLSYKGPPLLYPDKIITQGAAYDLENGRPLTVRRPVTGEPMAWQFSRNYGCDTPIGCRNLLLFRSAAAGYFDMTHGGGTGNFGGFRSSCTSNLIVADGVLSAPDYTRTCTCSYQNRCSLALVPMPGVERWTFYSVPPSQRPVQNLGLNFGAPGDRWAEDGTYWVDFPSVGGKSPDVAVEVDGPAVAYRHRHESLVDAQPAWVFASGLSGARSIGVQLAPSETDGDRSRMYHVRLYVRVEADGDTRRAIPTFSVQGQPSTGRRTARRSGASVIEYAEVEASDRLTIEWEPAKPEQVTSGIEICGLEVRMVDHGADGRPAGITD